jgi:hypothetical protein
MRALNEHLPIGKQHVHRVARIAQSVEQRIENPRVGSSILSPGTIYSKKPVLKSTGFFVPAKTEPDSLLDSNMSTPRFSITHTFLH